MSAITDSYLQTDDGPAHPALERLACEFGEEAR